MKYNLTMPENYKVIFSLTDVEICQRLKREKLGFDDAIDFSYEVQSALRLAASDGWNDFEVFEVRCNFSKNCRVWDYYGNSRDIDIWFDIKGYNAFSGFYVVGAYLSDLWSLGGDNRGEILSHMYIRAYKCKD